MGNYNPNSPNILGMEWAAFADTRHGLDIGTEWGYSFTVTGAPNDVVSAAQSYYIEPAGSLNGQVYFSTLYRRGDEDNVGEINVMTLDSIDPPLVTGAAISGLLPLESPADDRYVQFNSTTDRIRVEFDFGNINVQASLQGRRILAVDLLYTAAGTPGFALKPSLETFTSVYSYGPLMTGPSTLAQNPELQVVRLGEVNPFWTLNVGGSSSDRMPFRWEELALLDSGASPKLFVGVQVDTLPLSGFARLGYIALRVYYCEENRVACGGVSYGPSNNAFHVPAGVIEVATTTLRSPTTFLGSQTLSPGDYTITKTLADAGDFYNSGATLGTPELYQADGGVRTHPGVMVQKFIRPVGNQLSIAPIASETQHMVGIGLSSVGGSGVLQGGEAPHPYQEIVVAPIYIDSAGTSVTAIQPIHNEANPNNLNYGWVRFFARRFEPLAPGDLTVSVSGSGSATITAEEFAALPEIALGENGPGTGWKRVTLPISVVFSSDATFRNVTWSMTGVARSRPIDQYQILGASSTFKVDEGITAVTSLDSSRYDGLQQANPRYKTFFAAGSTTLLSTNSTLTVMFSQLSPAASGFAVTGSGCALDVQATQLGCETGPACVPTHILGNGMSWNLTAACDEFNREEAPGAWGTSSNGLPWTVSGGTTGTDYYVTDSVGVHSMGSLNVSRRSTIDGPILDPDVTVKVIPSVLPTGGPIFAGIMTRFADASNYYLGELQLGTAGTVIARLRRNVAGAFTTLTSVTVSGLTFVAGTELMLRFRIIGNTLQMKAWTSGTAEPMGWATTTTDTTFTTAGQVGIRSILDPTNTNTLPVTIAYDDFYSVPFDLHGGSIEIQRMDEVDDEWQTIVDTTNLCVNSFCDYEARTGVTSWYRIRSLNSSGFEGPWVTGSGFLASPGVSGVGDGNSVLIFTSNRNPDASLAYVMQFEGEPVEEFAFLEAGYQSQRTQYQKNFSTFFRPTERGGEAFERSILVHNAAVPAPSLGNFKSLRDLAWASLPYVCVRDELGNRWLANVAVPAGRVRSNRTIYIANVIVTEVTDTPAPYQG